MRCPAGGDPEAFGRDGFVVLERWISPSEREALQAEIDTLLMAPHESGCARPNNVLLPLRWNDTTVRRLLESEHRVQVIRDAVGATDLRWISGYASIKNRQSGPLWWHQDWWCWDHPVSFRLRASQVAVLCYLTPTDRERGALRLLPGSHRRSVPIHASLAAEQSSTPDDILDPGGVAWSDQPGQVTVEARPGDAVAMDYRL